MSTLGGLGMVYADAVIKRLNMALELAKHNPVYEDIASKFFEVSYTVSRPSLIAA